MRKIGATADTECGMNPIGLESRVDTSTTQWNGPSNSRHRVALTVPGGVVGPRHKEDALVAGAEQLHLGVERRVRGADQHDAVAMLDRLELLWQLFLEPFWVRLYQEKKNV